MLTFATDRGRLLTMVDGLPDEEFLPEADHRFHSAHQDVQITFIKDGDGKVSGFLWKADGKERKVPRIGPLFHSLKPQSDPDPSRTEKVVAVLKALGQGGKAIADSPVLTPGARADFGSGAHAARPCGRAVRHLPRGPGCGWPQNRAAQGRCEPSPSLSVGDGQGGPFRLGPRYRGRADYRLRYRRGLNQPRATLINSTVA